MGACICTCRLGVDSGRGAALWARSGHQLDGGASWLQGHYVARAEVRAAIASNGNGAVSSLPFESAEDWSLRIQAALFSLEGRPKTHESREPGIMCLRSAIGRPDSVIGTVCNLHTEVGRRTGIFMVAVISDKTADSRSSMSVPATAGREDRSYLRQRYST